jgi:hypothetical protein
MSPKPFSGPLTAAWAPPYRPACTARVRRSAPPG